MPLMQTIELPAHQVQWFSQGQIVQCGPVGAVWAILSRVDVGERVRFTLEPVDPHDVPIGSRVLELPMPLS